MTAPPFNRPDCAPDRTDLPWLRVRRRAAAPAAPAPPTAAAAVPVGSPGPPPDPRPDRAAPAAVGTSLDLSAGGAGTPPAPVPGGWPAPRRLAEPALPDMPLSTTGTVLTATEPVARLSRPQSGIGAVVLALRATGLPVTVGALWQSTDGSSGQVRPSADWAVPAPGRPRPVLSAAGEGRLVLDCRQIRRLHRACVYGRVNGPGIVTWTGILTVSTAGGATAVIPLEAAPSAGVMPWCTLVVVDGRLYVRAERRRPLATVRDLAYEFGFSRLTWVDADTAV